MYEHWASDTNVARYVSWSTHKDVEETKNLLKDWISEYDDGSFNWCVELKETGELVGNISVISKSEIHNNCEVGYCYGSNYWGKGYATEALRAVLDYLLIECKIHLIEAKHHIANGASGRVMEKAGMNRDGVLKERRHDKLLNKYVDLVVYSKTLLQED